MGGKNKKNRKPKLKEKYKRSFFDNIKSAVK